MLSTTGQVDKLPSTSTQQRFQFSLAEIQSATNNFDDELVVGKGGFGKVYKGRICIQETSHVVAIKRLDSESTQGAPEFRAEIEMLSKLRHCNLVSLIGYCNDNKEMILVYAYMPRGTLYHHLHKAKTPLTWVQRLKIGISAGRGLDYLHTGVGTQHGVIHRDVKSSNILLDDNWEALISDFGLSKIGPTNQSTSYVDASVKGTFGYLDPEYFHSGTLTRKTDVYAFGVVLFELLSGRLAVDERNAKDQFSLVRWAKKCVKGRKFDQLVDPNIRGAVFSKCLRGFVHIADRCLRSVVKERPTMAQVVVSLQTSLELQQRHDNSAEPSGITGFTWKIHKYLHSPTKQNAGQIGTSSLEKPENNKNQYKSTNKDDNDEGGITLQHRELMVTDLKCFTYDELRRATNNFGNESCFSDKSYVKAYKGWIDKTTYSPNECNTGLPIAIKRLDFYKPVHPLDLEMLKEFSHPNLVKLIGYCMEGEQVFLVYEFMPNRNLGDLLNSGAVAELPLVTKVKIAVGIARGIVFLQKTQDQVRADRPRDAPVSESRLDIYKIFLDKDYTAKLSGYDVTKLVDGGYSRKIPLSTFRKSCYYYPGCEPFQLQSNLSGFTVVFAKVLTGKQIYDRSELQNINELFIQHGKTSLVHVAKSCFEICNEVDSESKMLRIMEEYEEYSTTYHKDEATTKTFDSSFRSGPNGGSPSATDEDPWSLDDHNGNFDYHGQKFGYQIFGKYWIDIGCDDKTLDKIMFDSFVDGFVLCFGYCLIAITCFVLVLDLVPVVLSELYSFFYEE